MHASAILQQGGEVGDVELVDELLHVLGMNEVNRRAGSEAETERKKSMLKMKK